MRHHRTCAALVALSLMAMAPTGVATAEGLDDSLYITGFVSQGYLNTSENNYLVPRSINGTAEFTEAAVTVVARPQDRLRVGIQLLARNFGDAGNDYVSVDWAYGDYRFQDWFGVRLGKVKLPLGFFNEGRDVDMLRTSIFLPQSIYNDDMRDFFLAYEGIGGYGSFTLGALGDGDYHVYGGTLNVPDATQGFWRTIYTSFGEGVEGQVGDFVSDETGSSATATFVEAQDPVVSFPWIYGGALNWHTPLEGLRLGASGMQGRFNVQGDMRFDVLVDTGDPALPEYLPFTVKLDETQDISHMAVFGAEYLQDRWGLVGEYYHEKIGSDSAYGWYVQADWQVGERWALATYYADTRREALDTSLAQGLTYAEWQKDLTFSLRIDLTDNWLFKLETHYLDGVALVQERSQAGAPQRNWSMFAAKTTFHF